MLIRHRLGSYLKQEAFFSLIFHIKILSTNVISAFFYILFFLNPTQVSENSLDVTLECVVESQP